MARNISAGALTVLAEKLGNEPINILEVHWTDETVIKYCDKTIDNLPGKILEISALDEVINIQQSGTTSEITVTLDDTDEEIRNLMNTIDIHKRPCSLYQYFDGMALADAFLVFKGHINSPIEWDEGTRQVTFSVLSKINSLEAGFAPEEGQFQYISDGAIGKAWPMCFGDVVHVPAVKANQVLTGATADFFGFADATLQHKSDFLDIGLESLQNTYDFYMSIIDSAGKIAAHPLIIQTAYIDLIKKEDRKKQNREDLVELVENLNQQFDKLLAQYNEDPLQATADKLGLIKARRNEYLKGLEGLTGELNSIDYSKKALEIDAKNAKYAFNLIGKVRKKVAELLLQYQAILEQKASITKVLLDQAILIKPSVVISNGNRFPQGVDTLITVNDQTLNGRFNGNLFTIGSVLPIYTNIAIAPKEDTDKNTFYISDSSIDLANKYCLLPGGQIIRVTSQDGLKCTFELRKKPKKNREGLYSLAGTNANKSKILSGLGNFLRGDETDEELMLIANSIPKDLSAAAWKRLIGKAYDTQVIKMHEDTGGGTFTLSLDGFTTNPIPYNATADQVKSALRTLQNLGTLTVYFRNNTPQSVKQRRANSQTPNDDSSHPSPDDVGQYFTVTGGPLPTTDIEIKFSGKLLPMRQMSADGSKLRGGTNTVFQTFQISPNPTEGQFSLKYGDAESNLIQYDATIDTLKNEIKSLLNNDSSITVYAADENGDPDTEAVDIVDKEIRISYSLDLGSNRLEVAANTLRKTNVSPPIDITPILTTFTNDKPAPVACYVKTDQTGAHEYTISEIEKIIDRSIADTQYGEAFEKIKKELIILITGFREGSDDQEVLNEIIKLTKGYHELLRKIRVPESVIAEAHRLISDKEYSLLFQMQVLDYFVWLRSITPISDEAQDSDENYYIVGQTITSIVEAAAVILPQWITTLGSGTTEQVVDKTLALPTSEAWIAQVGSRVALAADFQEKFVVNILPSTIYSVYAYRSINGVRQLVPIPSRYYVKNEDENLGYIHATTITLKKPLSTYKLEGWEDGIFVTLSSDIGPNTCDIVEWIIETFTTLTIDTTTFASVKTALTNYPMNFALFDKRDALNLAQDIAFQARCALWVKFDQVYIKYLPEEPTSIDTLTLSDIELNSLAVKITESEDLITKLTAKWRSRYDQTTDNKIILRHNVSKYQEVAEEFDFFAYTNYDLILKSATFWLIRKANTWKRVTFNTFLTKLKLETFDCITLNLAKDFFSTSSIKGLIEKAEYNSSEKSIAITCWLPIRLGEMTKYDFAWPKDLSVTTFFPTDEIIISGNAGNPITNKIPTGLTFDPTDTTLATLRPKDYGGIKPSDTGDALPDSPVSEFKELDYKDASVANIDITSLPTFADTDANQTTADDGDVGDSNDTRTDLAKAKGEDSGFVGYGRVLNRKSSTVTDQVRGGIADENITTQRYNVMLNDGRTVEVRQLQIHVDETIPHNTIALVTYNKSSNEYEMQVPTWIGEYDV